MIKKLIRVWLLCGVCFCMVDITAVKKSVSVSAGSHSSSPKSERAKKSAKKRASHKKSARVKSGKKKSGRKSKPKRPQNGRGVTKRGRNRSKGSRSKKGTRTRGDLKKKPQQTPVSPSAPRIVPTTPLAPIQVAVTNSHNQQVSTGRRATPTANHPSFPIKDPYPQEDTKKDTQLGHSDSDSNSSEVTPTTSPVDRKSVV